MPYKKTTQPMYVVLGAYHGINNFDLVEKVDEAEEANNILARVQENDPDITFKVVKYRSKICPECEKPMDIILTVEGDEIFPWEKTTDKKHNIALWRCPEGHEKVKAEKE